FHQAEPLRLGMSREELRTRVGLKSTIFAQLLATQDQILEEQNRVRLAGHVVLFTDEQQARITELEARFAAAPYTPPSFAEAAQIVGEPVLYALIDLGHIVQVQPDVIFAASVYRELVDAVLQSIDNDGQIAANTLRDRFGTTRKYAIGLLEYLDNIHITRRVGDARVRGSRQA
ncbi:MAG: SelB C-terminal domain-containing protein, partial [Anaerolineae bacterium]|nr:SelB C-terminal domain-containing protein [Anaerolineae bacterium]